MVTCGWWHLVLLVAFGGRVIYLGCSSRLVLNLEKENIEKENAEKENIEKENIEKENIEKESIEKENIDTLIPQCLVTHICDVRPRRYCCAGRPRRDK
jgi:hypothetical protein